MISWPTPFIPALPGHGDPLRMWDSSTGEAHTVNPGPIARMYVCGITPYDATHLGHAATYVAFDLVGRVLRDAGHAVTYVQNVTDIDDPLLERAERDGLDWRDLASDGISLFREDMTALAVIPPDHYSGVVESMDLITDAVRRLLAAGAAYRLPVEDGPGEDVYFDLATEAGFGAVSSWSREQMVAMSAERGGDPGRAGKHDPLDPLLWRAARPGEPSWPDPVLGAGRPGWHIECTVISVTHLGMAMDIKGGGSDLLFPHHEMSAVQASGLTREPVFARLYAHQGMVGFDGEKMSKSLGNLVLVSGLRARGVDPMAIRLVLLGQHYRADWEYRPALLAEAEDRLDRWRRALSMNEGPSADATLAEVRAALADDLDAPRAVRAVDQWVETALGHGGSDRTAPGLLARLVDALLGVRF